MRVLMITPRLDESHDILGFIPTWVRKLAERVDKLYVITLDFNRATPLPENTCVYDLSEKPNKVSKYLYFSRLMVELLSKREVNIVFCHMSEISTIMAAPWARLFRVPIVQWYTHGTVSWQLRIAHFLANKVVTASKESFRIRSDKVIVTGHGIDTEVFKPAVNPKKERGKNIILSVGRISPRKDYETFIKAADILVNESGVNNLEFVVVGGVPMASQGEYYEKLKQMVKELELEDYVRFIGPVPHVGVVKYYQQCDVFVNASQTGGIDKTVLEAMACEKPAIACNEAFKDVLGEYSETLMFKKKDPYHLAQKIEFVLKIDKDQHNELCSSLREIVDKKHNVDGLMDKLVQVFTDA